MSAFLIAPYQSGLQKDLEPWLIPDDAYASLTDMYIFRGRVMRRVGFETLGQMSSGTSQSFAPFAPVTSNQAGTIAATPINPGSVFIYVVDSAGPPPAIQRTFSDTGRGGMTSSDVTPVNISAINQAAQAQITTSTPHTFTAGQSVVIQGVSGLTLPSGASAVNGVGAIVQAVPPPTPTTFEVNIDTSTTTTAYQSGGEVALGGTINYTTGAFTFSVVGLTGVSPFTAYAVSSGTTFPCRPVMGIRTRDVPAINQEETIFFDTVKANIYDDVGGAFKDISFFKSSFTPVSWTGNNANFFWTTNYASAFWATNNVPGFHPSTTTQGTGDGIRWYDGNSAFTEGWVNFTPQVDGTNFLTAALIIVPYYGRLVVLNTHEGVATPGTAYPQRARWCQIGNPFYANPKPVLFQGTIGPSNIDAWRSDIPGRGGFIDAPTSEHIVSAAFYKDQLVVFFERSTWVLLYTGDPVLPFIFERINSEFGCESTFSPVVFDNGILAVGDKAIVEANGNNVSRIDQKIPDEVFTFRNSASGPQRIHGVRDFFTELVYWTVPEYSVPEEDSEETIIESVYPTRMLVFNYRTGSYSFFKDCFTALGYFQYTQDLTWDQADLNWDDANLFWDGERGQSGFPSICAGNNQGYVMVLNRTELNDPSQTVTNIDISVPTGIVVTTCDNHCLSTGDFILLSSVSIMTTPAIVGEAIGTALAGTTSFTGQTAQRAIVPGSVTINVGGTPYTDPLNDGVLTPGEGKICYSSGKFTVNFSALTSDQAVTASYTKTLNGGVFKVEALSVTTLKLLNYDGSGIVLTAPTQDAKLAVVNNIYVQTKRFSPFVQKGRRCRFSYLDWYLTRTTEGEFQMDVLLDDIPEPLNDTDPFIIETKPAPSLDLVGDAASLSERLWHRIYLNAEGSFVQLELSLSDNQMICPEVAASAVNIHALTLYASEAGRLP